ncbi:MAG: beta-galactosidase [Clostridia bacterium]|nr:beta-galactosidase [Clostridia bacterium]
MSIYRNEHPNPQFIRSNWLNLNGQWDFIYDNENSGEAKGYSDPSYKFNKKINVPFCPESKLSGIGNTDFIRGAWYKRTVEIPERFFGKRIVLHFGACDFFTKVFIDGELVGTHKGGYSSFSFDVTKYAEKSKFVLTVYAEDDTRSPLQSSGKQCEIYPSNGCHYTRTTGIWQTVWLEATEKEYIESVKYYPNAENGSVDIQAVVVGSGVIEAVAMFNNTVMGVDVSKTNGGTVYLHLDLKDKYLWNIGEGNLYDLELKFNDDKVKSYFGLRSIRFDGMKFMLNDKSVFQRLVLDQGFYPDGIYTAPSDEAMIKDIQISMDAGFNGARLHEKIFEPRFLYHCDKMGYIVWGEYPNWGLDHTRADSIYTILPEWIEEIKRDFNHPAIIGWCPFNETWDRNRCKQYDDVLRMVYDCTKAFDSTRPCIDTSGNFHVKTDIFDVHDYEQDVETFKTNYDKLMATGELHDRFSDIQKYNGEPTFVSEYGGIKWTLNNDENSWGYGNAPKTEEEFIERYKGLTEALLNNNKMFGFCYTQLYDVEQEQNGLYCYDRTPKFDMNIFKEINSQKAAIED